MKDNHSLVIQSAVLSAEPEWIRTCISSVRQWAAQQGYSYRLYGDDLFDVLSDTLASKLDGSPVIDSDLARLLVCRHALEQGHDTVIWCDADFLIFDSETLTVSEQVYGVGREVWVDIGKGRPKALVKVHNAVMYFRVGDSFLDFYAYAAERILVRHDRPIVTQLVGPKLLIALHNIMQLSVVEQAAIFSPVIGADLRTGARCSRALELFSAKSREAPAAANLCRTPARHGACSDDDMMTLVEGLLATDSPISEALASTCDRWARAL